MRPTATGVLVTVRRGKTNQECETRDVRFVKGGVARAITRTSEPTERKPNERTSADREGIITSITGVAERPAVGDSILPPQWVVWNACRSRRMGTPTRFSGRGS